MAPELIEETRENTTLEFRLAPVTSSGPALPDTGHELAAHEMLSFAARYDAHHLLGRGGMGEVRLHRDARIGRDVAMKVIRADQAHQASIRRTRFLREARVQGQLEHPSIVPVYDVGFGKDGALYFTMKRVQGLTFTDIFDKLRKKDPQAVAEHTQRKLLAAFGSVCLAIAFAHTRRVIHRDLKPSNVMVGRFGEVYVLDWGIAKILDEPDEPS
ncbi:MAG: Protein kinase, partial [Myxococcaceae bacterium]|nr:Protein kinase [Myxococcaceae bacterium]